jgi:small subunit ribosomal protein S2
MANFTLRDLLEAGVHFGHQAPRWNPKMKKYIFDERDGIHIIDLQKTVRCLGAAAEQARQVAEEGEDILFVGTKKQAVDVIREEAARCGMFYVTERWLGGTLTNFATIQRSVARLKDLDRLAAKSYEGYTKKEALGMERERGKLETVLSGIKEMRRLPGAVFVVDCKKEKLAIAEASRLDIPVIAMVDTNIDPDPITFPVPANDDALRSIKLITGVIADAAIEGRAKHQKEMEALSQQAKDGGAPEGADQVKRHIAVRKPRTGGDRPMGGRGGDRPMGGRGGDRPMGGRGGPGGGRSGGRVGGGMRGGSPMGRHAGPRPAAQPAGKTETKPAEKPAEQK